MSKSRLILALGGSVCGLAFSARAETVTVTVQNLAPENGTWLTPVWVGFHNGGFDIFDYGSPAGEALERLAEDGNTAVLAADFAAGGTGSAQGTLNAIGPIGPGASVSMMFDLDGTLPTSRFFSYASMVIPSNDAFIANGNGMSHPIFDMTGNFLGADFIVPGTEVSDAGTEVNDEIPENTAFFGQTMPDTGVDENGVVHLHPGYLPPGSGGILDDPMFANADFTQPGYHMARITIVPEPASLTMLAGLALLIRRRRRR